MKLYEKSYEAKLVHSACIPRSGGENVFFIAINRNTREIASFSIQDFCPEYSLEAALRSKVASASVITVDIGLKT
jgi:hypothetical protein